MRSPTRSGRRSVLENHFYHKSIEFYGIPLHFSPIFCTKSLSLKGPHFRDLGPPRGVPKILIRAPQVPFSVPPWAQDP